MPATKPITPSRRNINPHTFAKAVMRRRDVPNVKLRPGDCLDVLAEMESESIHLVVTDPPYFLDGLDADWQKGKPETPKGTGAVGGLPSGMKFDSKQGRNLQAFLEPVAAELYRILKPGAFVLMFSAPRLSPWTAVALDAQGFEIRDIYAWRFRGKAQLKAFTMGIILCVAAAI